MDQLLIIAGPTATGKSDAAVALSHRMNGEVISADSMQVYRGMDIGSAKVTEQEMDGIPHHLIDVVDPGDPWNVVLFQQYAAQAVSEITGRGKLPVVAGGTGFYIQALLYDVAFREAGEDEAFRRSMQQYAQENGKEALHALLAQKDPAAAQAIPAGNVKRVIRALEYYRGSGEKISEHNREQRAKRPAYDAVLFVLTMDRHKLYERIDLRVDRMVQAGLIEEVRRLKEAGLTAEDVSMQGIGYRQILHALEGQYSLEEAVSLIKRDTRHFAKRQLTWFRREKEAVWIDIDSYPDRESMYDAMESYARKVFQEKQEEWTQKHEII